MGPTDHGTATGVGSDLVEDLLAHSGVKGMKWGVVNDEEGGSSPSGTRPVALTEKENKADPDGPDRKALVKKAALIGGGVVLAGAIGYGAYKIHQSGVPIPGANLAEKTLQGPTSIIHLARAKNRGLTFHAKGDTPDFFGIFDKLGLNGDLQPGFFEKTVEGLVASRFNDPLGRSDFAGRPITHDVVIPPSMSAGLSSSQDVVDKIWPTIRDTYQRFWDENEGPRLNHSEAEGTGMTQESLESLGSDFLEHHGVKGMKWGVRKDKGHEGEQAKTKKIAKLDKKFERESGSFSTVIKIHNAAADKTNKFDVDRINNKPEYKDADFRRDSPLRQKYYKEHQDAFLNRLDEAAQAMGTNASGTKERRILELPDGSWDVITDDVKHADTADRWNVKVNYDAQGHITSLAKKTEDQLAQADPVNDFLAHYGVKGMKWGVRKSDSGPREVTATQKKPGKFVKTTGGQKHPAHEDAIKSAVARQKAKGSTTDALSNKELQDAVSRMNLEAQFKKLEFETDRRSKGARFIAGLMGQPRYNGQKRQYTDPQESAGSEIRKAVADALAERNKAAA